MHILQLNTEKGWRGGERQTLLSMEGLRDAGVQVTLLCLRERPLFTKATDAGFPVIGVKTQVEALWYLVCHAGKYSVLHAQSSRIFGFAAVATLFTSTPLVYTRRVDFVPRGVITRWKYRRATALVAISGAIRDILRSSGMGEAEVISSIVPDYRVDADRCRAFQLEQGLEGRYVVGVVAALVGHKDPFTMIQAASQVARKLPEVLFLHFGDGPLRNDASADCNRLELGDSYRLCGFINNVEDYFPLFDCFAMSSSEEGLGSTVLDAFRSGIPVVSTAAGGLRELVQDRGLLSPPGDADALAENILTLSRDCTLATSLAEKAKIYVGEFHGRDALTRRYINLYRRITSEATL